MAFRYALPALAVAGSAVAQSCGSSGETTTIQNAGDASAIASCSTYSGSIAIATGTTDDIELGDLQEITGSLIASEVPDMTSLSGNGLQTIGDTFQLENVQILSTLNFPQLSSVGSIDWIGLPNLSGLSFTAGIEEADDLSIQNTGLSSLDGINLEEVNTMQIANNNYLTEISMQLNNIGEAFSMEANGRDISVEFPNMEWAYNMTFRNVTEVSMPSLASVNGSLGFQSNFFESVAMPNLTEIGGTLSLVANADLTNVSFPELTQITGGLLIANNSAFEEIDFPSLQRVGGAIDFTGNFTDVSMDELDDVRGAVNIQSSEQLGDVCETFQPLKADGVIRGPYDCAGEQDDPQGQGNGNNGGSGSDSDSDSDSAASTRYISGATVVLGVLAAVFGML